MHIISNGDNLHEISNPVFFFFGKIRKYYRCYLLNLAKEWERLIKKE